MYLSHFFSEENSSHPRMYINETQSSTDLTVPKLYETVKEKGIFEKTHGKKKEHNFTVK